MKKNLLTIPALLCYAAGMAVLTCLLLYFRLEATLFQRGCCLLWLAISLWLLFGLYDLYAHAYNPFPDFKNPFQAGLFQLLRDNGYRPTVNNSTLEAVDSKNLYQIIIIKDEISVIYGPHFSLDIIPTNISMHNKIELWSGYLSDPDCCQKLLFELSKVYRTPTP